MKNNLSPIVIVGAIMLVTLGIIAASWSNTQKSISNRRAEVIDTTSLIGKPLPDLALADQSGKPYDFSALKGKTAVLFFTEGLMCYPACWNQMSAFGTDSRFTQGNIVAVSVIADPPRDWQTAVAKMSELAQATILFDTDAAMTKRLGMASMPSSMHPDELAGHTYVIVDRQGIIRDIVDDVTMSVNNNKLIEEIAELYK